MKKDKAFKNELSLIKKNMRLISINGFYSIFEAKRKSEFYFEGECHTPWEMVYVIDGQTGITADDRVYTLSAGDVIFHKPMEFHKIWNTDGTGPRYLICSFDLEGSFSHRLRDGVFHLTGQAKDIMDSLINYLHSEFGTSADDFNYFDHLNMNETALQIILSHLELLLLYISSSNKLEQKTSQNEKMRLYTEIAGILEEHVYDKITISEIAKLCGVSAATIKNCFAEYAGCQYCH